MANSKRLCTGCKTRYPTDELMSLPAGKFHSMSCAIEYGQKNGAKARIKAKDKEFKEIKKRVRGSTRGKEIKKTQIKFNKYIRLRDAKLPCISCGNTGDVKYDAGHYKTTKAHPELRFDEKNVHKQCSKNCNVSLAGNIHEYRKGLIERFGVEVVDYLEGPHEPKRYTIQELKELQKLYTEKVKGIEDAEN